MVATDGGLGFLSAGAKQLLPCLSSIGTQHNEEQKDEPSLQRTEERKQELHNKGNIDISGAESEYGKQPSDSQEEVDANQGYESLQHLLDLKSFLDILQSASAETMLDTSLGSQ